MLGQLGYTVYAVSGALDALEVIESKDFDLVLSGIMMPGGIDGAALPMQSERGKRSYQCFWLRDSVRQGATQSILLYESRSIFQS